MTCPFRQIVTCPRCGERVTAQTPFERWFRNHPLLASDEGIVRFDLDVLVHRYMTVADGRGMRDVQALMFVEVKSWGHAPDPSQQDSLSLLSQVLRNRRPNMHRGRRGRHAADHAPLARARSRILGGAEIRLRLLGGHLLQLESEDPAVSGWMKWDRVPITVDQLVQLLRMEIDPDSLQPIDWRRRYAPTTTVPFLPGFLG